MTDNGVKDVAKNDVDVYTSRCQRFQIYYFFNDIHILITNDTLRNPFLIEIGMKTTDEERAKWKYPYFVWKS